MKKTLGIDYGKRKIGLSVAETVIPEPLCVVRVNTDSEALVKIKKIIDKEKVEKVVVGVSESSSGEKAIKFGRRVKEECGVSVDYFDETLTTQDAQKLAIEAGIKKSKRKSLEDAYAATLMLQLYLENYV